MDLIAESFQRLFPDKEFTYQTEMEYNRRLGQFNSTISLRRNMISVHLNLQWKDIDEEIKIGLIQHLLLRLFKTKAKTQNMDLYTYFVRNIPSMTPKTKADPFLEASFQRLNQQFFNDAIDLPNLTWGQASTHKLAHYNFHNDTITVSTIFHNAPQELLDYVMYHELLHKSLQFDHKEGRHSYHNTAFREAERRFPRSQELEREISSFIQKNKQKHKTTGWTVRTVMKQLLKDL